MMTPENGLADVIAGAVSAPPAPAMMGNDIGLDDEGHMISRKDPEPHEARRVLVKKIIADVKSDKKFWEKRFKMVKEDAKFAAGIQWQGSRTIDNGDKYTANVVLRHINGKVAALYAKNPKAIASRKQRMEYAIWDGSQTTLMQAQEAIATTSQAGLPLDPQTMALVMDIASGMANKARVDRIARTLELVYKHYQDNQVVPLKRSMKSLVRRVVTVGFGWCKLDFQREMEKKPDVTAKIADLTERMAVINRLSADLHDGEFHETDGEAEELRQALKRLQAEEEVLVSEGLTFLFPAATSIIPDKRTRSLEGFLGADWVTEEFLLTTDEVKEIYGVDLGKNFTNYSDAGVAIGRSSIPSTKNGEDRTPERCMVWITSNVKTGLVYTTCDGHADFLEEPRGPTVKLDRFWQIFPLTFNDTEASEDCTDGTDVFPPSDVRLVMSIQREYNRSRNGLREHRKANRPKTAVGAGQLTDDDKAKLSSHPAHAVLELQGIAPGQKVDDVLQTVKPAPIDPSIYDTNFLMEDFMRVVGSQEANIGGTSGSTATEASIAEGSRVSALSSNTDDLDDFLTLLARCGGQVLLAELSAQKATEIAGVGAAWPELTMQEIANEILLEIVAGSSGRPNKDKEIASLERLAPFMLQIPGIPPEWLFRQFVMRLDDKVDPEEAFTAGTPSIQAINALMAKAGQGAGAGAQTPNGGGAAPTGDGNTAPAQQGGQGAQNAPAAPTATGKPMVSGSQPNVDGRLGGGAPFVSA